MARKFLFEVDISALPKGCTLSSKDDIECHTHLNFILFRTIKTHLNFSYQLLYVSFSTNSDCQFTDQQASDK
jgi:hypothetical protein